MLGYAIEALASFAISLSLFYFLGMEINCRENTSVKYFQVFDGILKKYFEKYFFVFGCILENTIKNTFFTCYSHFLSFQTNI